MFWAPGQLLASPGLHTFVGARASDVIGCRALEHLLWMQLLEYSSNDLHDPSCWPLGRYLCPYHSLYALIITSMHLSFFCKSCIHLLTCTCSRLTFVCDMQVVSCFGVYRNCSTSSSCRHRHMSGTAVRLTVWGITFLRVTLYKRFFFLTYNGTSQNVDVVRSVYICDFLLSLGHKVTRDPDEILCDIPTRTRGSRCSIIRRPKKNGYRYPLATINLSSVRSLQNKQDSSLSLSADQVRGRLPMLWPFLTVTWLTAKVLLLFIHSDSVWQKCVWLTYDVFIRKSSCVRQR